jgi:hypothetical protein
MMNIDNSVPVLIDKFAAQYLHIPGKDDEIIYFGNRSRNIEIRK